MAGRVEGKVALVTGGALGIGRATALTFAREEAKLVIADTNDEGGQQTVHRITEQGGDAIFVRTDVSQAIAVEPVGRIGKPEEIAEAVVWLCSDAASFVTGHTMTVD